VLWLGIEFRVSGRTIEPSDYRHDPRSSLFKSTIFIVQNVFKEIVITVAGEFSRYRTLLALKTMVNKNCFDMLAIGTTCQTSPHASPDAYKSIRRITDM